MITLLKPIRFDSDIIAVKPRSFYSLLASTNSFTLAASAQGTRIFTGNPTIDTAAAGGAGAALGVATHYIANQIFNPCTRGGNRILGGQVGENAALGFGFGFAGAALVNNALGNPCGK